MFYKSILANLFVFWLLVSCNSTIDRHTVKSQQVLTPSQLEEEVYRFNNAFQYDSSILLIKKYLENPTLRLPINFMATSICLLPTKDYSTTTGLLLCWIVPQSIPHNNPHWSVRSIIKKHLPSLTSRIIKRQIL